jgi:hypothetical protein
MPSHARNIHSDLAERVIRPGLLHSQPGKRLGLVTRKCPRDHDTPPPRVWCPWICESTAGNHARADSGQAPRKMPASCNLKTADSGEAAGGTQK